ncbi:MAG: B12-binding domain-containing radical SAM protein [Armatimonadota bacterium]
MPKLVLVNPIRSESPFRLSAKTNFVPLNLAYVAAYTPEHWDIEIVDENVEPFRLASADLVGLTGFSVNAPRAYEIAGMYRREGGKVAMGGIHASMVPEEAEQYVDTVVVGEAEPIWEQVCRDFEQGCLKRRYHGGWPDLRGLRHPRRDLLSDKYWLSTVQTARGCPFACDFCSVTAFNGRKFRMRPVDEVLDEIETLPTKHLMFVDDNTFGYSRRARERAIAICEGMVERGIETHWGTATTINIADYPEALEAARRSGCNTLFIGFEALEEESLRQMNKPHQVKSVRDGYRRSIDAIHEHGMAIFGSAIVGYDWDEPDIGDRLAHFMLEAGVDIGFTTILTPLPGTGVLERMKAEGRLIHDNFPEDWYRYDFTEVVFRPAKMSPWELKEAQLRAHDVLFRRGRPLARMLRTWRTTGNAYAGLVVYRFNKVFQKMQWAGRRKWANRLAAEAAEEQKAAGPAVSPGWSPGEITD